MFTQRKQQVDPGKPCFQTGKPLTSSETNTPIIIHWLNIPEKPPNKDGGKLNVLAYWYMTNPCFTIFEGEVSHRELSLRAGLEMVSLEVYP